jgi:hypothetical protein
METVLETTSPFEFKRRSDWPVDIGIAAGCLLGYGFAWIGLVSYFHPIHWVAGVTGALAGCIVGWLWFQLVVKNGHQYLPSK